MGVSSSSTFLRKAESLPTKAFSLERKKSLEGVISLLGLESFIGGKTISEDDNEINFEKSIVLPIVEREYAQGVLINEIVKGPLMSRHKRNRLRQQLKEAKRPGETILKGHRSYDLMLDLQLGIRYVS
jgi:1-phosphatidylinositol-4-phosphate 5-kinase